jgi:mono/diheme cytochrome c family protein
MVMNQRVGRILLIVFSISALFPLVLYSEENKEKRAGAVTPLEADVDPGIVPEILGMDAVKNGRLPTPSQYSRQFKPVEKIVVPGFLIKAGDPRSVPDTDPNLKAGRALYNNTCARCHGVRGDGRGPEADGFLTPMPPANFMDSAGLVSGGYEYAYKRLNEGGRWAPSSASYQFSAMPSWQDDFTETQKWQIILYLFKNAGIAPKNLPKSK